MPFRARTTILALALLALAADPGQIAAQAQVPARVPLAVRASQVLAQHEGTIMLAGIREPVEVLRDTWGVPHIYATLPA